MRPCALLLTILLVLVNSFSDSFADGPASNPSVTLLVDGEVDKPASLDVVALRLMPETRFGETAMRCAPDRIKSTAKSYRGVLLRELLNRAQIHITDKHEVNRIYVVASATDGYQAMFSWHELFNSPIGESVLVVYERDGQALGKDSGAIALLSDGDTFNCGRHVKWLNHLAVRKLKGPAHHAQPHP